MTRAIHPVMRDRTHETSTEAISKRLEEALILEGDINDLLKVKVIQKTPEPKGISPEHTELIKRINRIPNRSELNWDQKSEQTQKEIQEAREVEKKRQEQLKKIKWEQEQPWDGKEDTFDQRLDRWNKQTEELLKDFQKD